jgi:DNA replication protein DnaC
LEELADATLDGTRKHVIAGLTTVPLLIIDDLGMRRLPHTAAEDLLVSTVIQLSPGVVIEISPPPRR